MYPIKADKILVTSKYGNRTYTYKGKKVTGFHHGIDLVASPRNNNAEIVAFADGVVTMVSKTGVQGGKACYVRLKHCNGLQTLYYHLKSGSVVVNVGDKVKKGQKLGIIGKTGTATGIHLHFQIDTRINGKTYNPYDYLFNGKEFIKETKVNEWTTGRYTFIYNKYMRSSTEIKDGKNNNYVLYKNLKPVTKTQCISKNGYAQFKADPKISATITKIIEKDGRIWGQYANAQRYVVLCNKDSEPQAKKVS